MCARYAISLASSKQNYASSKIDFRIATWHAMRPAFIILYDRHSLSLSRFYDCNEIVEKYLAFIMLLLSKHNWFEFLVIGYATALLYYSNIGFTEMRRMWRIC